MTSEQDMTNEGQDGHMNATANPQKKETEWEKTSKKAKSLIMSKQTYEDILKAGQNPAKHPGAVSFTPSPRKSKK